MHLTTTHGALRILVLFINSSKLKNESCTYLTLPTPEHVLSPYFWRSFSTSICTPLAFDFSFFLPSPKSTLLNKLRRLQKWLEG